MNFGDVKVGQRIDQTIKLTNTGDADLILEFVTGSCDCTVPDDYPRKPIKPGESAIIKYHLQPEVGGAFGPRDTTIDIISNTDPIVVSFQLKSNVVK